MKKEQSKKESSAKKIFSQIVWVLSVALYFISEGVIQLSKRVMHSGGKTAKAAKKGKRRPNPVTAARRAENQEQETTAAAAVTAAKKAERPAHAAAAKAPAAPAQKKPATTTAAHKSAVAASAAHKSAAPAAHKTAAAAATVSKPATPAAQKPAAPAAPAAPVKKPEEQPQAVPSDAVKKPAAAATVAAAVHKAATPAAAATVSKPATPAAPAAQKPAAPAAPKPAAPAAPVKQPAAQPAPAPAAAEKKPVAPVAAPDTIAQLQEERAEKKPLKKLYVALICLLLIAVCILLGIGVVRLTASVRANNIYKDLASNVQQSKDPVVKPTTAPLPTEPVDNSSDEPTAPQNAEPTGPVEETIPPETEPQMLPQYAPLYEKNPDLFGWVKIDDTKIDYPVMYAPDDLEKYLYHDFEGNSYSGGTPYMDVRCTSDSENYLIYGHNMKNGTMFKHLMKYQDEKFWKDHQTVYFGTLYSEGEYEVVAAFYDRVYYKHEDCFKFYDVIELEDEDSYDDAIANFKEKSMYDTGVTPEYGTQLVTLITCAYHVDNGKFVVVLAEK